MINSAYDLGLGPFIEWKRSKVHKIPNDAGCEFDFQDKIDFYDEPTTTSSRTALTISSFLALALSIV